MKCSAQLLLALSLAAPASAWAVNVCTDASGKTVYQQQPCLALAPRQENAPVAARAITPAVAAETVRRFRASLSSRDATNAANFLAPGFTASIQTAKGTEQYDRAAFADMLSRVLNAATAYKSAARCSAPVIADASATVACEVHESLTILKKTSDGVSSDTHRIAVVDGAARFVSIASIQRDK